MQGRGHASQSKGGGSKPPSLPSLLSLERQDMDGSVGSKPGVELTAE